ncbi:replication protein RepA [Teredinibacter turnerae]|uniref:replication protein RepA n=1 Tax=Teredinibacter turnerae TaxID=2426 RepID=UPI000363F1A3|nr:replication protein RepA [Teredinibacter turnerae]
MNNDNLNKLITESLAIEEAAAKEAGKLGFMARALVQATLPHSEVDGNEFERTNGAFTLSMLAPSSVGLPYGNIPRLLISWLTTEAVKTRSREVILGDTLTQFMHELDMAPTGGRWGSITRLRDQMTRLFSCFVSCSYVGSNMTGVRNIMIADEANLWWSPKNPDQAALWQSSVRLSERFYEEVIENPVPIDIRALKALRRSPMALDIYCWLTYRLSYLKKPTQIPWGALQTQFGANYATTQEGTRNFKKKFLMHLKKVLLVYPDAKLEDCGQTLLLKPSPTHIPKLYDLK